MSDKTLPCWSYPPNWANGILESLEWKSSVTTSPKGAEQRRMLRLSPRRFLEFQVTGIGPGRSNLDLAVWAAGGTDWNLPLWWDYARLTADASASATTIFMNTTYSEFEAAGLAFVQGPDYETFDVVEIVSVAADRLNLVAPGISRAWKEGTRVYPMRQARLADQPQLTRHNDNVASYQMAWVTAEKNVYQAVAPSETYLGYKVYRMPPNETGSLAVQWARMLVDTDNGSAIPYRVDTANYGFARQQHEFFIKGRQAHADFRKLLYWLRGRVRPAWVPTFFIDMRLLSAVTSLATTLTIQKVGVAAYVHFDTDPDHPEYAYPGRRHIMIHLRDGTAVYALMTDAVDNDDGTETVTLSAPVGIAIDPEDILRISFMALMRLNQDRVEINHLTDAAGVSQSVVSWVSTPENRDADAWSVDEWAGIMDSATCTMCDPPLSTQEDDAFYTGGYNPITHEIWTTSQLDAAPYNQVGYRFSAGLMTPLGAIVADNPDTAFTYADLMFCREDFLVDAVNEVMWTWGQLVDGMTTKHCILKFDANTAECLHAITPAGTGVSSGWRLFVHPVTNELWQVHMSGSTTMWFRIIDTETLQPASSYSVTVTHTFFSVEMDSLGNIWYVKNASGSVGREVWVFDTTSHTSSKVFDNTVDQYTLVPARTQGTMWVINNLNADGMVEFDDATKSATGRVLDQPLFSGTENCKYDSVNNVMWGLSFGGDGALEGISLVDGSVWGTWNPRTPVDTVVLDLTNSFRPPAAGISNALYLQDEGYRDPAETVYGYAMVKVPICNVVRG